MLRQASGEKGAFHIIGAILFLAALVCVAVLVTSIGKIRVTEQKANILEEQFETLSRQVDDLDTRIKILEMKGGS